MHDVLRVRVRPAATNAGRQRFRDQAGECERNRIGQRQRSAHAGHLPHGHSRVRQESFPFEHSGPAHLVRDPRQQGRLRRPRAGLRPDGRDELADLCGATSGKSARAATCCTIPPGRSIPSSAPRRRDLSGRAARARCATRLSRSARAHSDEEHRLRRRAGGRARYRHGDRRGAARREIRQEESAAANPITARCSWATTTPRSTSLARCRSISKRWTPTATRS